MTNLSFTTPILVDDGNEIDRVEILLTTTDIQELLEKVVRAVELGEIDELREYSNSMGITESV